MNTIRSALLFALLLASFGASATVYNIGTTVNAKVVASSIGLPCDSNCWEYWQIGSNLGGVVVVKDSLGRIVEAGRLNEPYFLDLYLSTDEATRKVPSAYQITRIGTVRQTGSTAGCSTECVIALDFGGFSDVFFVFDGVGKLNGAVVTVDASGISFQAPAPAGEVPRCGAQGPFVSCVLIAPNVDFYSPGYQSVEVVEIIFHYDENGNCTKVEARHANGMFTTLWLRK